MTIPAVIFDHVSKVYSLSHTKTENFKDRLTRMLKGGAAPAAAYQQEEDFYALRDVSFEIKPGESVGIIGPNGSGKSTSLKILAGVTKPSSGRFEIHGRLGALIEVGAGFHPELTGRENVYMNGSILGMSKKEINRKFDSIVDFSEIEQFIDTPVKHYSSGMYVRLGFAVAIHNEPEIMLVDEALAVGDLGFQNKCFARMEALKNEGRTFILVSHSMGQIQEMCDRAIMLNKGELIADEKSIDVAAKYIDLMAAPGQRTSNSLEDSGKEANLAITNLGLAATGDDALVQVPIGAKLAVRIDYEAKEAVEGARVVVNVLRMGVPVYRINSGIQGVAIPPLAGKGQVLCMLPDLALFPNRYGLDVLIWDAKQSTILARKAIRDSFTVMRPEELSILGCGCPIEPAERSFIYGHAQWEHVPNAAP
ncbi:MAG: polysaccharide ABC transporter ATP-binding protein [Pseudomonadota bacterium]|nr:polysaccharide ABC transporter ATP-binding protein [Pseudomonadota bacterium]